MERNKVGIYNVNPGELTHQFHTALTDLILHDMANNRHVVESRTRNDHGCISMSRNAGTQWFLNHSKADWQLWLDSDEDFPPDTLDILMELADPDTTPVIGGLYISPLPEGLRPLMWRRNLAAPHGNSQLDIFSDVEVRRMIDAGVRHVDVDATGAGCLLVHRSVLEEMIQHYNPPAVWFCEEPVNGVMEGEDFGFCRRVRELGHRVVVDLGVDVGHYKPVRFNKSMLGNVIIEPQHN